MARLARAEPWAARAVAARAAKMVELNGIEPPTS